MSRWFTITFLLPVSICALGSPRYECGEHGRFEYCIDGVPGCVVGCHCHPGYYFDTETKICEPNAKLVEEYRRLYVPEPTRVQVPMTPSEYAETLPTPTTTNPLDNQIDAIAKDTDDLGDWLYNQFFKNIENQVTNSSNKEPELLTRRSGSNFGMKRSKKIKKSKGARKINIKNKDLRRKLFRITEDDSLFDSQSDSSGDDSDSSSISDSSDTSASCNKNSRGDKKDANDDDKEHGHRKFVMINKKPRAPLPSFIFLPNLETPFFPPIGLPPPPAVPMYPMVPVPPMPVFPFPATTTINGNGEGTTTTPSSINNNKEAKNDHTANTPPKENELHKKDDKNDNANDNKVETSNDSPDATEKLPARMKHLKRSQQRNKMLQALRSNMNFSPFLKKIETEKQRSPRKHFIYRKPVPNPISDIDSEVPMFEEPTTRSTDGIPRQDVNFKYLTQLIHKVNPNMTHEDLDVMNAKQLIPQRRTFETRYYNDGVQPKEYVTDQIEKYPLNRSQIQPPLYQLSDQQYNSLHSPPPLNKLYNENSKTDKRELDDLYYANLGQQIASFIRKIDNEVDHPVDIEIEPRKNTITESVVLNENSYAPRSFWERSVRSPLNYFHPYTNDFENNQRNYENLLNIESKIKTIATTEQSLSLREIENVVFMINKNIPRFQKKIKPIIISTTKKPQLSTDTLNINLLPRHSDLFNAKSTEYYTSKIHKPISKKTETLKTMEIPKKVEIRKPKITEELFNRNNLHYNLRGILMNNFRNVPQSNDKPKFRNDTDLVQQIAQRLLFDAVTANKRRYDNHFDPLVRRPPPVPSNIVLNHVKAINQMPMKQSMPVSQKAPTQKQMAYFDNALPFLSNVKLSQSLKEMYQSPKSPPDNLRPQTINNVIRGNNHFGFDGPQNMLPIDNILKNRFDKPSQSYFHHEVHHFDYFD